jgi:hypothetical protein
MSQPINVNPILDGLIDELAAIEHERWSHWQRYMHSKGVRQSDGSLVLPAELVARWDRQASTDYQNLSVAEKESDREQVNRYLPIIAAALNSG